MEQKGWLTVPQVTGDTVEGDQIGGAVMILKNLNTKLSEIGTNFSFLKKYIYDYDL